MPEHEVMNMVKLQDIRECHHCGEAIALSGSSKKWAHLDLYNNECAIFKAEPKE